MEATEVLFHIFMNYSIYERSEKNHDFYTFILHRIKKII